MFFDVYLKFFTPSPSNLYPLTNLLIVPKNECLAVQNSIFLSMVLDKSPQLPTMSWIDFWFPPKILRRKKNLSFLKFNISENNWKKEKAV